MSANKTTKKKRMRGYFVMGISKAGGHEIVYYQPWKIGTFFYKGESWKRRQLTLTLISLLAPFNSSPFVVK